MVRPSRRTRSVKKVQRHTPGARDTTLFRRKKAGRVGCGRCGKTLAGVAAGTPTQLANLSKSSKVPARPYAGVLCPGCISALNRYAARMEVKHKAEGYSDMKVSRDLTLEKYLPRGWFADVTKGQARRKSKKKAVKRKAAKAAPKKKAAKKAKAKAKSKG